ncbi:UDP-N-acetylmuramate dehydrogenase [Desulfuromonas thiophila]|uniref:UDP-N-acetylmuramate dehydrogenase n=1 Tax=Desulfuromonas thiophila TaxID=57664 RepID=UPI0024A96EC8|nr:UDP-N-acetylmuramate dehydrogenase [Desulfuromonas thiophila]
MKLDGACAEQLRLELRGTVTAQVPLAPLTRWRIGGPAELLVRPADRDDALHLFALVAQQGWPYCLLGGGSNLLVADAGVAGLVIQLDAVRQLEEPRPACLRLGAGWPLPRLIAETVRRGLAGLEHLAGIPGTVGGAVVMNAGVAAGCFGQRVQRVLVVEEGLARWWSAADCAFAYRDSALGGHRVVLEVELELAPSTSAELAARREAALRHRRQAQRVGWPNAGSVFRNPPGHSAWQLIAACGLRGERCGDAQVSEQHCNFIVNRGTATAAEVLALIRRVQQRVARATGICLEPEIHFLGDFGAMDDANS